MAVFHNSDPMQKAKFLARASYLAEKGSDVDMTELRRSARRTTSQNALFWAWCALMADTIGDNSVEAVARDVKREILGRKKVYNVFTGEESYEDYHTSEMSEEEMSKFLTAVKLWAQQTYNWWLPSRDDPGFDELMQEYGRRK